MLTTNQVPFIAQVGYESAKYLLCQVFKGCTTQI
jgi:hypothetical protein